MERSIYKIIFYNNNKVVEVYAEQIFQSDLYGFLEIEDYIFGERSQMIVDPGEEKLRSEFAGVKRSYIPIHSVIRIDEVEKEGVGKISDSDGSNVTPINFSPMKTPSKHGDK